MKRRTLKMLLVAEFIVIVLLFLWIFWYIGYNFDNVELLCETSPDGDYVLRIEETSKPVFSLYPAQIRVNLYSHIHSYAVLFDTKVATGDGTVHYEIEWLEDGVLIILSGKESHYYILPFKTLEDSRKLL
ncbi:MAG: hypothetical protein K2O97_11965 [Acetatifactor sp.]|nr:hypothetical protein [Acetatifactor sp.]MDE7045704.1 hypothetical protein [Acetatifactor sp.]